MRTAFAMCRLDTEQAFREGTHKRFPQEAYMARFWCKVCDEPLRTVEGAFVATCAACGARQALPQSLDEEYLQHFGELCRMRQNGDIEGAHALVNAMLDRFSHEAALYWQRVLVTYEAKYRQESGQCEYVLECGRAAPTPVLEHVDYQKALSFSSAAQRAIYEEDARLLERSRRILCGESYVPDVSVSPLNSGFLCLEDGEWDAAMAQFDSALEEQPQNALAYFGKMMAELHVRREAELPHVGYRLPETENHRYVLEYGDDALRERLHHHWETGLLAHAVELCGKATSVDDWKRVKKLLQQIPVALAA
jgi:tetratricopeptide (TPR) repeat protein